MERAPGLQPLSREHHHGLVAARRLSRAADGDKAARAAAAASFGHHWDEWVEAHFEAEEELLVPLVPDPRSAQRLVDDHGTIRELVGRLMGAEADVLRELGTRLHAHIRWEERELFPLLEARVAPEDLERLERALGGPDAGRAGRCDITPP